MVEAYRGWRAWEKFRLVDEDAWGMEVVVEDVETVKILDNKKIQSEILEKFFP